MANNKIEVSFKLEDIPMIIETLEKIQNENKQLKEKINDYENPDDMTLMFMWCDEKAKDKIKNLQKALLDIKEYIGQHIYYDDDLEQECTNMIFNLKEQKELLDIVNKALGDKE